MFALFVCVWGLARTWTAQTEARHHQLESTYGVSLTDGQFDDLRYPLLPPTASEEMFGPTNVIHEDLTVSPLTLTWDGKQLLLVGPDGRELPHR